MEIKDIKEMSKKDLKVNMWVKINGETYDVKKIHNYLHIFYDELGFTEDEIYKELDQNELFFYGPIERLTSLLFSYFSDDLTPIKRHSHWLKPIESISDGKTIWIRNNK